KKGALARANFSWKDFGSWDTVYQVLPKDKAANAVKAKVFLPESHNNLVYSDNPKKKILVMGLKDVFFIDTEGFTLLAARSQIDNLKKYLGQF
ncbi:MAG: hypothetical protein KKH93_05700, partial [Candidatus Omnitrophica bacterium]|nr:hypothetical protein [Candidatus Omnitrophota bacterium]